MLKPRKPLTLKVVPSRREEDLSFVPEVYLFCGSLLQLIGSSCDGRGEEGAVVAPGLRTAARVPSTGRNLSVAFPSSGVLSIRWVTRYYLNRRYMV